VTDAVLDEHATDAAGGQLSSVARRAAVISALPLLGRYFARGSFESRDIHSAAGRRQDSEGDDPELDGLRLRVALTAARRLAALIADIRAASTFRYQIVKSEQTGAITGTLDINRWATTVHRSGAETVYPVQTVVRGAQTPENVLAAYALRHITRELKRTLTATGRDADSVDYRAGRALLERLEREQQLPPFAAVQPALVSLQTRVAVARLLNTVERRIRRREISKPTPWQQLATWVAEILEGDAVLEPGEQDLAAYDDTFDRKLFELWCLRSLAQALATALNIPEPRAEATWRADGRVYVFNTFAGTVSVYFQRSIPVVDDSSRARWLKADGVPLGGIPDIVLSVQPRGSSEASVILVDPKLRQRERTPTEELYKILGYFHNYSVEPARGAILTYTVDADVPPGAEFGDGAEGKLVWSALNPIWEPEQSALAFEPLVAVVLDSMMYSPARALSNSDLDGLPEEERAAVALQRGFQDWARTQAAVVAPSRERVATILGDTRWAALAPDAQSMLATADTVGPQLGADADFSGPVIGLSAAIELLIHERIISGAFAGTTYGDRIRTFGACVHAIKDACDSHSSAPARAILIYMRSAGVDVSAVRSMVQSWLDLNSRFRIPAAHREVMTQQAWRDAYRFVLGDGGVLARTIDALG